MDAVLGSGKSSLRFTITSVIIACVLFFGGGWVFVKIARAAQHSRAAANVVEVERAASRKLPEDIPLYKSGNLGEGKEYSGVVVYEIIFTLGSIEEVKAFYEKEMPAKGWQVYAEGSDSKIYLKTGGRQKASMNWQYDTGRPKLRLTISKINP